MNSGKQSVRQTNTTTDFGEIIRYVLELLEMQLLYNDFEKYLDYNTVYYV